MVLSVKTFESSSGVNHHLMFIKDSQNDIDMCAYTEDYNYKANYSETMGPKYLLN